MDSTTTTKRSTRAPPRRAKKDGEAPVFLQKTYQMITECPPAIASWSDAGDTFIVKDSDALSGQLPKFFKHNNFRSFVRQLNFYGFRKLRTDGALISDRPAHWWEFRHEKFIKGRPELLAQIKRANHYETPANDQSEVVEDLRSEVSMLKDRIDEMGQTIEHLTGLVDRLMLDRQQQPPRHPHDDRQHQHQPPLPPAPLSRAPSTPPLDHSKKRRLQQPRLQESVSIDILRSFEHAAGPMVGGVADEAEMLSQLSLDGNSVDAEDADFDRSLALFDFALESPPNEPNTPPSAMAPVPVAPPLAAVGPTTAVHATTVPLTPAPAATVPLTTDSGLPLTVGGAVGTVEMPPVAPFLAQAAIGAFITKLAEAGSNAAAANAMEGAPLLRTLSSSSMVVSA